MWYDLLTKASSQARRSFKRTQTYALFHEDQDVTQYFFLNDWMVKLGSEPSISNWRDVAAISDRQIPAEKTSYEHLIVRKLNDDLQQSANMTVGIYCTSQSPQAISGYIFVHLSTCISSCLCHRITDHQSHSVRPETTFGSAAFMALAKGSSQLCANLQEPCYPARSIYPGWGSPDMESLPAGLSCQGPRFVL